MGFGGVGGGEGVADTRIVRSETETEAELRRTMEEMDGHRMNTERTLRVRNGPGGDIVLSPGCNFPLSLPNDTALVPCGHRRSESRPPWCRVFTDCGFGGPCWGGDLGLLGRTVFRPTAELRLVKRLPSPPWQRERYRGHLWHFLPEKNGNWSAGSEASRRTAVEANGQVPVWWCGGLSRWCQVFRYQMAGREFIEA